MVLRNQRSRRFTIENKLGGKVEKSVDMQRKTNRTHYRDDCSSRTNRTKKARTSRLLIRDVNHRTGAAIKPRYRKYR